MDAALGPDSPATFAVMNIGCKVNRVEVDAAAAELLARGARMVRDQADLVVVNTCTVTAEADKKTRKAVRQALAAHPHAQLLVTGCAAVMNPTWFEELDERVHVVPKSQVVESAWGYLGAACPAQVPDVRARAGHGFRTRVGIKAQDGCNNACTYCIVHVARGASSSVPFQQVLDDARVQAQAGVRELVLTGINLGAYRDGGRSLADLLAALLDACPQARFRIGSVEPCDVDEPLVKLMAASDGRICRHLHLPLQSGSSRVLSEMNRPYDAAFFLDLVARLRQAMPQLSLSTDIIVGFPGETEEDFQATLDVARQSAFSRIHVFRYSRREGTPAAARADQVAPGISAERSRRLQRLGRELALADAKSRLGTSELVLVEREGQGTSESYHPVHAADGRSALHAELGALVELPLTRLSEEGVFLA